MFLAFYVFMFLHPYAIDMTKAKSPRVKQYFNKN